MSRAQIEKPAGSGGADLVLFGNQAVESGGDSNTAGLAESFPFTSSTSGSATSITMYLDSGNQASGLMAGLYTDENRDPGSLLARGSVSSPAAGAWNTVTIPATPIRAGTTYWIGVLGVGGRVYFRDGNDGSCESENSAQTDLSGLPSKWEPGQRWSSCPLSAYVSGIPAQADDAAPPASIAGPVVTGSPVEGQTLSTSTGSWSGAPTSYSYAWEDCDNSGAGCATIPAAASSTYTLADGDVGHTVRAVVTALNSTGSASAESANTAAITPSEAPSNTGPAPANTAEPVISGTVGTGRILSTTNGTWTGTPTAYTYQWQDCAADGTSCSDISAATSSTYVVQPSDAGNTIKVVVTAANSAGSASAAAPIVPLIDEFAGTSVDNGVWSVLNQQGDTSNDEQECYEPSQVSEGSGALTIENAFDPSGFTCPPGTPDDPACTAACKDSTKHYLSGAVEEINTAFTYGTVVVRARLSGSPASTWPAIWLLGADCQTSSAAPFTWLSGTPDVADGYYCPWSGDSSDAAEIDIAEGNTGSTTSVSENVYNSSAGAQQTCTSPTISDYSQNFHTYELDWSPGSLVFKIDGSATGCGLTGSGVPTHPMFLIINGADQQDPNSADFPASMTIDYVRVSH